MIPRGPRRSFLLLPGHEPKKAAKAATLATDAVIFDIEDGVPHAHKAMAREEIVRSFERIADGPRELMVRINEISDTAWRDDLAAIAKLDLAGIYVPKVESRAQIEELSSHIASAAPGLVGVDIYATIETARGLVEVEAIAGAPGLHGLFFGSGDYSLSTGIEISSDTLRYPRSRIAVAAAANGLQPVDVAYFKDVKDRDASEVDARDARALGFTAKVVFHPNQIEAINSVFTPSGAEITRAERICAAYLASRESGRGVFLLDGEFVAIDIAKMAERTLARAARTGVVRAKDGDV